MTYKSVNSIYESYKTFKYKYDPLNRNYVSKDDYKSILYKFFTKLLEHLMLTGNRVILPCRMGDFQFMKYKKKYYKEIYNRSSVSRMKPIKEQTYSRNMSTNDYWFELKWHKYQRGKTCATFNHKNNYVINLSRPNMRPNSYNKNNPKISAIPFFRDKGWLIWEECSHQYQKYI